MFVFSLEKYQCHVQKCLLTNKNEPTRGVCGHSIQPAKAGAAPKTDETECPGSQFDAADRASRVIRLFDHNYVRFGAEIVVFFYIDFFLIFQNIGRIFLY